MNTKGYYADLKDGVAFPLTLQMSDLINPTTIKTSYSKTITIPRTDTNDKIFSEYFKLDKLVDLQSFNALEKTPFTLYFNGTEELFAGWVKLNKITATEYELNLMSYENLLFSELAGKKLSELQIDLTHNVDRNFIWNGWNSNEGIYDRVKYCPSYKGLYNDFSSDKKINYSSPSTTVDLGEDIDEYQKFELRSYYQQPAIKLKEVIQAICNENNITLASEDDFFTSSNPYWDKLFMVNPKLFSVDKPTSIFNPTYRSDQAGLGQIITNSVGALTTNTVGRAHNKTISDDYEMENTFRLDLSKYPSGVIQVDWEFDIEIEAALSQEIVEAQNSLKYLQYVTPTYYRSTPYPDNGGSRLVVRSYINGQNNAKSNTMLRYGVQGAFSQYREIYDSGLDTLYLQIPTVYTANNYQKFRFLEINTPNYDSFREGIPTKLYNELPTTYRVSGTSIVNNVGEDVYISFTLNGFDASTGAYTTPAFRLINSVYLPNYLAPFYKNTKLRFRVIDNENLRTTIKPYNGQFRSNYKVTSENVLDPSIDQAKFLVDYMKLFGLVCEFDKLNKNYVLSSRNKFFSSGQKVDWTYKVQIDKMEIEPTPIDARKYKFKWGDISATHYERYNKVFDSEYGSVLINTNNEHLDNTEIFYDSLFSCPLIEQSYNLDQYSKQYRLPFKALSMCTYNGATRTEAISSKPTLIFFDGLEEYPLEVLDNKKNWMIISDDTSTMIDNNDFYWSTVVQSGETSYNSIHCVRNGVPVFPKFVSLIENVASLDFAVPKVVFYDKEVNSISDGLCIYNRFYEKFMNDKLSVHNRVVTVPVNLNNVDIKNFKFNNFYYINNTPYVVIKIADYNPANDLPTKVTLLRVMDFNNYKIGQNIVINSNRKAFVGLGLLTFEYPTNESCNISTTYNVSSELLISEKGFYIDGFRTKELSAPAGEITTTVNRLYRSRYRTIKSFIVYNGVEYVSDEYKVAFPEYIAEFNNFTFNSSGDNYILELKYSTNMTVKEQGFIINGVTIPVSLSEGVIQLTRIQDLYTVIGYIIGEDDTYIQSNTYLTR